MKPPLISKPFSEFTPDEYHAHVKGMYALRIKGKPKPPELVPGLRISLTAKGALSIRRNKKVRPFEYVLGMEIDKFCAELKINQQDLWVAFKKKNYIVAPTKMEAERANAAVLGIPWERK